MRGGLTITAAAPSAFAWRRVGDAGARAVGRGAGDDRHAARRLLDDDLEHRRALVLLEPRHLAGDAERGQAVDALVDEEIDDPPLAGRVDVARRP